MGYKTILCPKCGSNEVHELYDYIIYSIRYDDNGNMVTEPYEQGSLSEYWCAECDSEEIVTLVVNDKDELVKLNELEGKERIKYALKLIRGGKAKVIRGEWQDKIRNNIDFLVYLIKHHVDTEIEELAKEVLKEIAPREVVELL